MSLEWAAFWVGLIGSIATVAALAIAIHEVRAWRSEQAQRDKLVAAESARQRRAQAECVSAQLLVDANTMLGTNGHHFAYAEVFNASALPIYDIEVWATHLDHPGMVSRGEVAMVPGGQKGHVHTPPQPNVDLNERPVDVTFRDASGVAWVRHRDGVLHEPIGAEPFVPFVDCAHTEASERST
jgi:hypothetical protein